MSEATKTVETYYVVKVGDDTLYLETQDNGHAGESYELVTLWRADHRPEFRLKDEAEIRRFLRIGSRPYYNTSPELPGWGGFKAEQMRFVKKTVTVEEEAVDVRMPPLVKIGDFAENFDTHAATPAVRERFAPNGEQLKVVVVWMRDDGTFEIGQDDMRDALVGKEIEHGSDVCELAGVQRVDEHSYRVVMKVLHSVYAC